MKELRVSPAYGRDYKSLAAAKADWEADKDFRINDISHPDDGRYVNKPQVPEDTPVLLRYHNERSVGWLCEAPKKKGKAQ